MQQQLMNVSQVAELLGVSAKHVGRLSEAGGMPRPVRLGRSKRWRMAEVQNWIQNGCQKVQPSKRGGVK
ncbi:MAG: helix-turn-helix domain-containing protein [Planctomycetales bacterium]|nr:helix-turn-helix domain-containing protein [Planctomycetales bacterium]